MTNELIFFAQTIAVAGCTLGAALLGKEALTTAICLFSILANLFVTKQITLFGLDTITTDVFMIGSILGLNMMQEYYGKEIINKIILINFAATLCYLVMSGFLLWYTPNTFDTMHEHFAPILTPMLRIIIASVIVYLIAQYVDSCLYAALKKMFAGKYLILRNVGSLAFTQLLDTILFSIAALYGSVHNILHVMIVSYSIKLLVIICSTPCIALAKRLLKKA